MLYWLRYLLLGLGCVWVRVWGALLGREGPLTMASHKSFTGTVPMVVFGTHVGHFSSEFAGTRHSRLQQGT